MNKAQKVVSQHQHVDTVLAFLSATTHRRVTDMSSRMSAAGRDGCGVGAMINGCPGKVLSILSLVKDSHFTQRSVDQP